MIRSENFRSIGLKKTLVFYSGKAPKGIRTSWIMNEYRLPHQETERLQKAEISLCRVYKRPGVEDHPSLPRSLPTTRASPSRKPHAETSHAASTDRSLFQGFGGSNSQLLEGGEKTSETSTTTSSTEIGISILGFPKHNPYINSLPSISSPIAVPSLMEGCSDLVPNSFVAQNNQVDDLQRLISFHQQASMNQQQQQQQYYHNYHLYHPSNFSTFQPQLLQSSSLPLISSDRLWEWSSTTDGAKDHLGPFK